MPILRICAAAITGAAVLVVAPGGAYGQESGSDSASKRTVTIAPRVSVTQTLTDNIRLTNLGKQSEQITEISPGIRIGLDGARLKGYFDYSLIEAVYAQNSSPRNSQNSLNTFGTFEAIDRWVYLDFGGTISQQTISAFAPQSIDNVSINANQSEVSSYRLSPYVRGRLGQMADYEARYSRAVTRSDSATVSGVTVVDGAIKINGGTAFRNLGWSADATRQNVDYSLGRPTEVDSLSLGLSYAVTPQLNVFANAGRETNNYFSLDKQRYGTSGFGVNWLPSEATKIRASWSHLSFGEAHKVSFEHRTARTAWKFTDSKDMTATPSQTGSVSLGAIYDLLYAQFETIEPNPALRAQLVDAYLQANGLNSTASVTSGFLTSAMSLQRRQDLSFALLGVRDTITFVATRSETTRLDTLSTGFDDLSTSSLIRQRGFSVNYAHRLTPDYSLGILASQQKTSGSLNVQDTTLRSLIINVAVRVGKQSSASLGARRTVSSGGTVPYSETAVTGNLNVQF